MYMKNKITGQIIYILLIIETSKKRKEIIFQYAYILVHVYFFIFLIDYWKLSIRRKTLESNQPIDDR